MKDLIKEAKIISSRLPPLRFSLRTSRSNSFGDIRINKKGVGEEFFDFRKFRVGDSIKNIDWKKSSKTNNIFIKETEKESSQDIWIWKSNNISMNYSNKNSTRTKSEKATLIGLILIDLCLNNGENIGVVGSSIGLRNGKSNFIQIANEFLITESRMRDSRIKKKDIIFIISDFLENPSIIKKNILQISESLSNVTLIQILDPAELNFPFKGRNRFFDPVSGNHKTFNKSENMRKTFIKKISLHNFELQKLANKAGWNFFSGKTNESSENLVFKLFHVL